MREKLTFQNIQSHCAYLINIRELLNEDLKKDSINRIEFYLPKIGITSQFVYSWIKESFLSMTPAESKSDLENIKDKFRGQLELNICKYNIYLIKHNQSESVEKKQFWLSKVKQISDKWFMAITNDPTSSQLLQASRHVEDLISASRIISEDISDPEVAKKFSEAELAPFIQDTLSEYLDLLTLEKIETKEKVKECFSDLNKAFSKGSFDSANIQLSELNILLYKQKA